MEDMKRKQEKGRGTEDGIPPKLSEKGERESQRNRRKNEREKGMSELLGWYIPRPDITEAGGGEGGEE